MATADMTFEELEHGGVKLEAGLGFVAVTAFLIATVTAALALLAKGKALIEERARELLRARHLRDFARDELTRAIKGYDDALAFDGTGGQVVRFVFPKGRMPVTRRRGHKLIERAEQVVRASEHASLTGAVELRAHWLPILRQRIESFRAALAASEAATQALKVARSDGRDCRQAFVLELERVAGQLRIVLAGDPRLRNSIWPRWRKSRRRSVVEVEILEELEDEDEEEEGDDLSAEEEITPALPAPSQAPSPLPVVVSPPRVLPPSESA